MPLIGKALALTPEMRGGGGGGGGGGGEGGGTLDNPECGH